MMRFSIPAIPGEVSTYYDMDYSELAKRICSRIEKFVPESALKITGCIFLKDPSNQELIDLACGPDDMILSAIRDAKYMLYILAERSNSNIQFGSFPPHSSRKLHDSTPYWKPHLAQRHHSSYAVMDRSDCTNNEIACCSELTSRTNRRSSSPEFPSKLCHFFSKGYCKHGTSCRYLHDQQSSTEGYSHLSEKNDQRVTLSSLEKLEMEIVELLRSKKGPISIASLHALYYDMYGRSLQAEGYLTESQRHGKIGYNLTKLLANLSSIRLIARPHGQHAIVLVGEEERYMEFRNYRNESSAQSSSSHQIYLTFPAESTFTADDVSNYFSKYGPVQDVRIPCQDKRMFGFVSFVNPETVSSILMKGNPHFIRGARILVKPYREKTTSINRAYTEKTKPIICHHASRNTYLDPGEFIRKVEGPQNPNNSGPLREKLNEEHEKMIENERICLSEFSLASRTLNQEPVMSYRMATRATGVMGFPFVDHFSYEIDDINGGMGDGVGDAKAWQTSDSSSGHGSNEIELPESPFSL